VKSSEPEPQQRAQASNQTLHATHPSHAGDEETNGDMPLLKVWLQDMLEKTKELTTDTVFKAYG
jgi:hypothetical protein